MPEFEGIEFINEIIRKRKLDIPVIVISGHPTGIKFLEVCLNLGAKAQFKKHINLNKLKEKIEEILK